MLISTDSCVNAMCSTFCHLLLYGLLCHDAQWDVNADEQRQMSECNVQYTVSPLLACGSQ